MSQTTGFPVFENAILFLANHAPGGRVGLGTLWKLAYLADYTHRGRFGQAMTGMRFRKERHGPVPVDGDAVVAGLTAKNAIVLDEVKRFEGVQRICSAPAPPDLAALEFAHRATLEEIAMDWMSATGRMLEAAIRESGPWKAARYGDILPLDPAAATSAA